MDIQKCKGCYNYEDHNGKDEIGFCLKRLEYMCPLTLLEIEDCEYCIDKTTVEIDYEPFDSLL